MARFKDLFGTSGKSGEISQISKYSLLQKGGLETVFEIYR